MSTEQLMERRMALLAALYDQVDGDRLMQVPWQDLGHLLDYPEDETEQIADWLMSHGYAEARTMGGLMRITPAGMDAVEEERTQEPDEADRLAMAGAVLTVEEARLVEPLVSALLDLIEDETGRLDPALIADLAAQAATLNAQMRSPRPRRSVVAAVVASVKWAADGAGQAVIGAGTVAAIAAAWNAFGG